MHIHIYTRVKANTFFTTPVELCTAFIMGIKCENSDRLAEMKGGTGELQNVRLIQHKSLLSPKHYLQHAFTAVGARR